MVTPFTPYSPIVSGDFCYGRKEEVERIRQAILARGRHIVLFGERGSGKTSLANISYQTIDEVLSLPIVCSNLIDNPEFIWKSVLEKLQAELEHNPEFAKLGLNLNFLNGLITDKKFQHNHLIYLFRQLQFPLLIVMDEVDLLSHHQANLISLAETIKMFSDQVPQVTLLLIGIANKASDLMVEHVSLERCLIEIKLERMKSEPLMDILEGGLMKLGMNMVDEVKHSIVHFSEGLPFYVHLLADEAVAQAQVLKYQTVVPNNYEQALKKIIDDRRPFLEASYKKAIAFSKNNLYQNILKVAASKEADDLESLFSVRDILNSLSELPQNREGEQSYSSALLKTVQTYLNKASTPAKGELLKKHHFPEFYFSKENASTQYSIKNPFIKSFIRDIIE